MQQNPKIACGISRDDHGRCYLALDPGDGCPAYSSLPSGSQSRFPAVGPPGLKRCQFPTKKKTVKKGYDPRYLGFRLVMALYSRSDGVRREK
jgi:hypothetical protein